MEIWKDIKGYEGLYQISNKGRVKSFKMNKKGKLLNHERLNADGYAQVALRKQGKAKELRVARLVAIHFIGYAPDEGMTVNHIDGNKLNDNADNLEWLNKSEQMTHAYKLGLKKPVKGCRVLTLKEQEEIKAIYEKGKRGKSALALGRKYGVSATTIERVVGKRKRRY